MELNPSHPLIKSLTDLVAKNSQDPFIERAAEQLFESSQLLDGAFVRRGHWVAASEVEAVERDGRRLLVRTRGGEAIAVSPAGREELRARGWIR